MVSFINGTMTNAGMSPIVEAKVLNPFNIKEFVVSKRIVLDVRVRNKRDWLYDIKVQTTRHPAFTNRVLYYWADTYSSQMSRGDIFTQLRPVISIILTRFPVFSQIPKVHVVFELRARENPKIVMTNQAQFHFLQLAESIKQQLNSLEGIRPDFLDWLNFFAFGGEKSEVEMAALTHDNPLIQEAYAELQRFYGDHETRERMRDLRRFIVDYELGINASKEEAMAQGMASGKADSIIFMLTHRYGFVPQDVQKVLLSITDIARLDALMALVYDSKSMDEFVSSL